MKPLAQSVWKTTGGLINSKSNQPGLDQIKAVKPGPFTSQAGTEALDLSALQQYLKFKQVNPGKAAEVGIESMQ